MVQDCAPYRRMLSTVVWKRHSLMLLDKHDFQILLSIYMISKQEPFKPEYHIDYCQLVILGIWSLGPLWGYCHLVSVCLHLHFGWRIHIWAYWQWHSCLVPLGGQLFQLHSRVSEPALLYLRSNQYRQQNVKSVTIFRSDSSGLPWFYGKAKFSLPITGFLKMIIN